MMFLSSRCIVIASLFLLLSCTEASSPPLRVGTTVWLGYEPLFIARQRGSLKEEKVHLVEFSTNSQSIQAFRNGLIDAAALTLDEVLLLLESGEKLKIVLVMDISNGADTVVGQSEITSIHDIRSKRVGFENNAVGGYILSRLLEINNIDTQSIKLVEVNANEQKRAFLQREVDVVVTYEPVNSQLLAAGGKLLFDSSQLPDEIVDVLVVRDNIINDRPYMLKHLLDVWFQSLEFLSEQPREAAKLAEPRLGLDINEILASLKGVKFPDKTESQALLRKPGQKLLPHANKLAEYMLKNKLLKKRVDPRQLFMNGA